MIQKIALIGSAIAGFMTLILSNPGKKDVSPLKILIYTLLFAISIGLFGCTGIIRGVTETEWWFVLLQMVFLVYGSFHYHWVKKGMYGEFEKPVLSQIMLALVTSAAGCLCFALIFNYCSEDPLTPYFALSVFTFLIPYGFMITFELLASVPPEIYKVWYYPLDMDEPDFDKIDLNNIYLLELEFAKSPSDSNMKNYKARAPIDMIFGEWYRSFINNYNYKFEEDPIQFLDSSKQPHGWMFYTKPQSFWQTKRFIDPDLTIKNNKLTERTVIVAKRVEVKD